MQLLQNIKSSIKNSGITLLELATVRLEMAKLEINQQKERLIKTLILVLFIFVFFLFSTISLLFGLDAILLPEQKQWVFFAISGGSFALMLILALITVALLKKQRHFMHNTLEELKLDIEALKSAAKPKVAPSTEVRGYDE
ncbi:hypothetical protein A4G20_01795 [Pasteurellaceae bacterium RH1A]|nr:hypothetical protein A4G20_01795 [Pasteurellaceae bacterium RH1A]